MSDSTNAQAQGGSWLNLIDPGDTRDPFGTPWPLHFALGPVADYAGQLALDPVYLAKLAPKRSREFSTGRYLAAKALQESGCVETQVPRHANRAPIWPPGFLGSISHSSRLALVATTQAGNLQGLGVDIEECQRLGEKLFDSVFTDWEQAHYARNPFPAWPDLVFSAKEAIYKAVNPSVGKFIGFHEVEVEFSSTTRFGVRYIGDHAPNAIMNLGNGYAAQRDSHVMTLFAIAAPNSSTPIGH